MSDPRMLESDHKASGRHHGVRARLRTPGLRLGAVVLAGAALLAGCANKAGGGTGGGGSGGSGGNGPSGTLEIANFDPFSGPNAAYGAFEQAGCLPAVNIINADGGVLGHKLTCTVVDDRGDPADAVPAAQNMLATSPNLVAIVDQNSGLLTSTTPLFNAAHIPELSLGGDIPFDHNHFTYFWRTIPGDDVAGYALAAYIKFDTPYTKVASVFTNDQSAQGNVPGLANGAKNLGLDVVSTENIAVDQTSYETEIQRVLSAHPQVMASESDPQTAGVLYSELKQANALFPGVLTSGTVGANWDKAMVAAIGAADFKKYYVRVIQFAPSTGLAWHTFDTALTAAARTGAVKQPAQYASSVYSEQPYDNVVMIALAMLAAHSVNPVKFNPYIAKITQGSTVVHTFAQGKAALAAGKTINYVGVQGQVHFDQYHNSAGVWGAFQPLTNKLVKIIPAALVSKAEGH